MGQFAIGIESGDIARAQKDRERLSDLLATTVMYALCCHAFEKLLENAKQSVSAGRSEEEIVVMSRETWSEYWILSLPAIIFQIAYESGISLRVPGSENLLGTLAGWFSANTAPEMQRYLFESARRTTNKPQGAVFDDTVVELALQLNELQEDALDAHALRKCTATSLKKLYASNPKEHNCDNALMSMNDTSGEKDRSLNNIEDKYAADELANSLLSLREKEVYEIYTLSDREIAERLGMAIGTVASNKHRIRQKFAEFSVDFC